MHSSKLYIFLLTCKCSFVLAQSANNSVTFVNKNEYKVNVYRSKGFVLSESDKAESKKLDKQNKLFVLTESNGIDDLNEDDLNLAYSHAKLKLDRAILFFDEDDIVRYTDFLNKILLRLKQLSGL